MTLGEFIRNYRERKDLSMEEFAKRAGMSKPYISMLESNKNSKTGKPIAPSIKTIQKCARAMNMTFDNLMRAIDQDIDITPSAPAELEYTDEEKGIIRGYRKAPDPLKEIVRFTLKDYMKDEAPAAPPKEQPKEETKEEAPKIGKWGQVILDHDMLIYSESNIAAKDEVESLAYNPQFEKIVDDTYKELEERDIEYEFFVNGLIKMVKNNRDDLFKILDKPHHVAVRFLETRIRSKMR